MTDPDVVVQIDVSTVEFDRWTPNADDALLIADVDNYLSRVVDALELADRAGGFDLVLYNAGMDPANSGVQVSDLRRREHLVAEWADRHAYPIVYALAGGYTSGITMAELVDLHLLTVEAFG